MPEQLIRWILNLVAQLMSATPDTAPEPEYLEYQIFPDWYLDMLYNGDAHDGVHDYDANEGDQHDAHDEEVHYEDQGVIDVQLDIQVMDPHMTQEAAFLFFRSLGPTSLFRTAIDEEVRLREFSGIVRQICQCLFVSIEHMPVITSIVPLSVTDFHHNPSGMYEVYRWIALFHLTHCTVADRNMFNRLLIAVDHLEKIKRQMLTDGTVFEQTLACLNDMMFSTEPTLPHERNSIWEIMSLMVNQLNMLVTRSQENASERLVCLQQCLSGLRWALINLPDDVNDNNFTDLYSQLMAAFGSNDNVVLAELNVLRHDIAPNGTTIRRNGLLVVLQVVLYCKISIHVGIIMQNNNAYEDMATIRRLCTDGLHANSLCDDVLLDKLAELTNGLFA